MCVPGASGYTPRVSDMLSDATRRPDGWGRALHASLILFAVAASWSIAIALTAVVMQL